jgi:hypothetical protein
MSVQKEDVQRKMEQTHRCIELIDELAPPEGMLPQNIAERALQTCRTRLSIAVDLWSFCLDSESIREQHSFWAELLDSAEHLREADAELRRAIRELERPRQYDRGDWEWSVQIQRLLSKLREAASELSKQSSQKN